MPCRYLWKTELGYWVCSESGRFVELDSPEADAPKTCGRCHLEDSSAPTSVERQAFLAWQQEFMSIIKQGEQVATLVGDLDELNERQKEGNEPGVRTLREEMLAKYRDIGLMDICLDDYYWTTKMRPLSWSQDQEIDEPIL